MAATLSDVEWAVRVMAETVVANETYFGDLDAVVGDGDFGYSMARGFEIVLVGLGRIRPHRHLDVPQEDRRHDHQSHRWDVRSHLGYRVPAGSDHCSGGGLSSTPHRIVAMLRAAIEGIKARGGAELGDKTLLDALIPATDAIEERAKAGSPAAETLRAAADSARSAAEATRPMLAKKGRAAYTGERSVGTLDAGAVAVAVLLEALSEQYPADA